MPGHLLLYHPAYEALHAQLEVIGEIKKIHASRLFGKDPHPLQHVHHDLIVHDLALIADILPDWRVRNLASEYPISHTTNVQFCFQHAEGNGPDVLVSIENSKASPNNKVCFTIIGENGRLNFDSMACRRYNATGLIISEQTFDLTKLENQPLFRQFQDFVRCIRTGDQPRGGGLALASVTSILEQISSSTPACIIHPPASLPFPA